MATQTPRVQYRKSTTKPVKRKTPAVKGKGPIKSKPKMKRKK